MTPESKRQLAAILFADIQGYTALMQQDEQKASVLLRHFQKEMEAKVADYNGRIVNFYGDGALCIFQIPVEAVRCAMVLQNTFTTNPKIPVRIGIHSGTVTLEGDKIFGDSVNITSRIESMGIPGTVLLSKKVRDEVKNNPDLRMQSLGKFEFKNVKEPLTIFALEGEGLVVPGIDELKGKQKEKIRSGFLSSKTFKSLAAAGILIILVILLWNIRGQNFLKDETKISNFRVTVLPFENKTGQTDLDAIGEFTADWILQQLVSLESVNVVSLQTVKAHSNNVVSAALGNSFYERTGAEKLITGSYYIEGDQLLFQSRVADVRSGEIDLVLPMFRGDPNNISKTVEELSQRILAFLDLVSDDHGMTDLIKKNPPKFSAYRGWLESLKYFGIDDDAFFQIAERTVELDSTFFWIYLQMGWAYGNMGAYKELDSIIQAIESRVPLRSNYEVWYFNDLKNIARRDRLALYNSRLKIFNIDPKNPLANYLTALAASEINRPYAAIRHFEQIKPGLYPISEDVSTWWHQVYSYVLTRTGNVQRAKQVLHFVPRNLRSEWFYIRLAEKHLLLGETDSIYHLLNQMETDNFSIEQRTQVVAEMANDSRLFLQDSLQQMKWAKLGLDWLKSSGSENQSLLGRLYFLQGAYDKSLANLEKQVLNTEVPSFWSICQLGFLYAQTGATEKIEKLLGNSKKWKDASQSPEEYSYAEAVLNANLGKKERAVELLKQAFRGGFVFDFGRFDECFELMPLHGYIPYEEFVKPQE